MVINIDIWIPGWMLIVKFVSVLITDMSVIMNLMDQNTVIGLVPATNEESGKKINAVIAANAI